MVKASLSGNDISCEIAHRMAERAPDIRVGALKAGVIGALLGGGVGGLLAQGGSITALTSFATNYLGAYAAIKGIQGISQEALEIAQEIDKGHELLQLAIASKDPQSEAEARRHLDRVRERAIDAGFDGAVTFLGTLKQTNKLSKISDEINVNQATIVDVLSKPPKPLSDRSRN